MDVSLRGLSACLVEGHFLRKQIDVWYSSYVGWGVHPVSTKSYHFIIPAETGPDSLDDSKSLAAITEACRSGKAHEATIRLPTKVVSETAEHHASIYNADPTIYDSTKHRLHGVIHANGFGHLLRINGMYGGSQSATGLQILALWDTLCDRLRARDITVEDVSSKSGMELRMVYLLAYGQTWYGLLGYRFGRGPYNITEKRWQDAGTFISSILLSQLLYDFQGVEEHVLQIINRYSLPVKGAALVRDFGALLYRLLFLQLNPEQAAPFFDKDTVEKAKKYVDENGRKVDHSLRRKRPKKKGLKFSVVPKKRARSHPVSNGYAEADDRSNTANFGNFLTQLKTDPALAPNNLEEVQLHSELEVVIRGELEKGIVTSTPSNRGRMHRIKLMNGKTRKIDLHVTPWRFKGSLAPLAGLDKDTIRMFKQKEESKLESIKNSKNNSSNPAVLKYKANLSRDDFVERARQLCRALKSLIPNARGIVGQAKTRIEMEAAFATLVGKDGPLPTCKNSWWGYLPKLLLWIQDLLEIRGPRASNAIKLIGNTVEIDREYLHSIGMFPESWDIPLKKASLIKNNSRVNSNALPYNLRREPHKNTPETKNKASANARTRTGIGAVQKSTLETEDEIPGRNIDFYVHKSIDSTLESLWRSSICPDDEKDAVNMHRSWHDFEPGNTVDDPNDLVAVRNQISRDLHFLFMCTLKLYLPEVAKVAGQNAALSLGEKFTPKLVKARQISEEARVLRDTKHFVKTYHSSQNTEVWKAQMGKVAVWTKLHLPPELNSQQMSTTRFGRKLLTINPPDELIAMDEDATITEYLLKVTERFRSLYAMCTGFKANVAWIQEQDENNKHKRLVPSQNGQVACLPSSTSIKSLLDLSKSSSIRMAVAGHAFDLSPAWLHAGGPEDWVVNCPCGTRDDDGEAMVSCDTCEIWMHTRCVNVPDDTHGWLCKSCKARRRVLLH